MADIEITVQNCDKRVRKGGVAAFAYNPTPLEDTLALVVEVKPDYPIEELKEVGRCYYRLGKNLALYIFWAVRFFLSTFYLSHNM